MALIVEDGTGKPDAESLASVEFADIYHANRGNTVWATLDTAIKEQLLRKATDYAVTLYATVWGSLPMFAGQALPFPRVQWGAIVPPTIQQAIAELALTARSTPLMPNVTRGKKRVKVGSLEVEYDGNAATSTQFVAATLRFAPFLSALTGGPFARLVRT